MICTKCGTNLPDNAAFCTTCGTAVTQPTTEQAPVMEQPIVQPPVMEQPMAQQPMMQQPMAQPPMMQQPMAQPPMGQPPMGQPPIGQPPMMQAPMMQAPMAPMMQPKKSKAPWIILGISITALIAVIVTVVILLFACNGGIGGSNSSTKSVVTAFFEALADKDEKDFNKTLYPVITEMYASEDYSYFDDICDEFYEILEDRHDGTVKSFTVDKVTIKETEKVSAEELAEANSFLKNMDGYEKMTYGSTILGTVDITIKGKSYELEFEMEIVGCDGDYYILDISDIE